MKSKPTRESDDIDAAYDSLKGRHIRRAIAEALFTATDRAGDFAAPFDKTQTVLPQSLHPLS